MLAYSNPQRDIHVTPDVGMAAHVVQGRELQILRIRVEQPALICVERGIKAIRTEHGIMVRAQPGQAILLAGGQTVDFTNSVVEDDSYEARWLVFDPALLEDPYYLSRAEQRKPIMSAQLISKLKLGIASAFTHASEALDPAAGVPAPVARQRMLEVLHWLLADGLLLRGRRGGENMASKVRALIAGRLDYHWTADAIASELALSQATLRRRLASESSSLTELLVDTRMATALTLLQATTHSVSHIALSVGYESPSRFAIRFRQRFGFAPTAVRGHERTN
jgi:AraC-like DNA-binding protein